MGRSSLQPNRLTPPANGHGGVGTAVAVSVDETLVFVAGSNVPTSGIDCVIAAYDSDTGSRRWISTYDSSGYNDDPSAMAVSSDGMQVFVTGSSIVVPNTDDYVTLSLDAASGSTRWVQGYDGPAGLSGYDVANAIAVTGDGSRVFVSGTSFGADGTNDYPTLGYDAATGSALWLRRFEAPVRYSDNIGTAVGSTPDGSIAFVTGLSWGQGGYNYLTLAYDGVTGIRVWIRSYDAGWNRDEQACRLAVTPDGSKVIVSGYGNGLGTNRDYLTVAYAASGS